MRNVRAVQVNAIIMRRIFWYLRPPNPGPANHARCPKPYGTGQQIKDSDPLPYSFAVSRNTPYFFPIKIQVGKVGLFFSPFARCDVTNSNHG